MKDRDPDIAGALHDVSNALTVLLGWVAEARAPGASAETVAYALDVVERRARMARDLARQTITGSGAEGQDIDAESVVTDALAALRVEAERAGVKMNLASTVGGIVLSGGPEVSHGLTNMLLNAIAFSPKSSTIHVSAAATPIVVQFDVEDEGPGIAPERRGRVFQGDSTRAGGSGVGLRYARSIAWRAGGNLELLDPSRPGRGARFRLTWPRVDAKVPPPPPSVARVRSLDGKQVLLVEDDNDVVALLETALMARGAEVTVVATLTALYGALMPKAGKAHFDAILLDFSPINERLSDSIRLMRQLLPGTKIIVISGASNEFPAELLRAPFAMVPKPFEVQQVVDALLIDPMVPRP